MDVAELVEDWSWGGTVGVRTPSGVLIRGARDRYEIGSITKVFTGLALARGPVAPSTSVGDLLPPGVRVPDVRLSELAAHTSRLPRLPAGLMRVPGWRRDDPYAHVTADWLYEALARTKPRGRWRRRFHYSNLGVGLLGHALALRHAGSDERGEGYAALVRDLVCDPLGLADTSTDGEMATPHDRGGTPVPPWNLGALAGAGGLRSTVEDLLAVLENQLGDGPLSPAWLTRGDLRWHNGGTGGSASFAGYVPSRGLAVVALSNSAVSVTPPAVRLLRALSGAPSPSRPR